MRLLLGTLLSGTLAAGAAPAISEGVEAHSAPFRPDPGPVPPPCLGPMECLHARAHVALVSCSPHATFADSGRVKVNFEARPQL